MNLSKQEIKDWIRISFTLYNPDFQFDFTYYPLPLKLQISLTYRENKNGSIFLSLSFRKHFEEPTKMYFYDDEWYGERQSDEKLSEEPTHSLA